jgi:hypothetical protein
LPMPQSTTAHTPKKSRTAPLEIGDPAPEVRLPDLMGREMSLADLRGNKTLLLCWSPECSSCQEMLPDLKKLEANRPAGTPEILVVSEGTEEDKLRMDLRSPVVLITSTRLRTLLGWKAHPQRCSSMQRGRIASKVTLGVEEDFELAWAG